MTEAAVGLEEFLHDQVRHLEDVCADKVDSLMPYLLVEGLDGEGEKSAVFCAIADLPETAAERVEMVSFVAAKLAAEIPELTPVRIAFLSEAWTRRFDDDKEWEQFENLGLTVSQLDDKDECAIITTLDRFGNKLTAMIPILRDENSCIVLDTENSTEFNDGSAYILEGFFPTWMLESSEKV